MKDLKNNLQNKIRQLGKKISVFFNFDKLSEKKKWKVKKEKAIKDKKNKKKKNKLSEDEINNIVSRKERIKVKLSLELIIMSVFPIVLVGIIVGVVTFKSIKSNAVSQIENDLYTAGVAVISSFEQNVGDYTYNEVGDLWKGGYNISKSEKLLSGINEKAKIDISIFSKDNIVITTAKDTKTGKAKKIVINDSVVKSVFKGGYEDFNANMTIDGKEQYMYAIPMLQTDKSEVMAMMVVSCNKEQAIKTTNRTVNIVIIIILVLVIVISILTILFSRGITNSLKAGFKALETLSQGNLKIDASMLKLKRRDEIGEMSRSIYKLSQEFRKMISNNINLTADIEDTANDLDITAKKTKESINTIDVAMDTMANTAKKQANIVEDVNSDMIDLGEIIKETYGEIKTINDYNIGMQNSSKVANKVVGELTYIRESLNSIIEVINQQTTDTYHLTKEINKYAEMIASFADETNLLALNASIEAARVGEQGKGFAIVATQIQSLADQSNVVSNDISKTINKLVNDSKKSMATMGQVNSVIEKLNTNIDDTREIFNTVNEGIGSSLKGLKKIEDKAAVMDDSRASMMMVINDLAKVAQQNIKCAADTEEITKHIGNLFIEVNNIKNATERLVESIDIFEV